MSMVEKDVENGNRIVETIDEFRAIRRQLQLLLDRELTRNREAKARLNVVRSENGKINSNPSGTNLNITSQFKSKTKSSTVSCSSEDNKNTRNTTNAPKQKPIKEISGVKKEKKLKVKQPKEVITGSVKKEADVSLLDIRVGLIEKIENHPDADSLYIETVDFGNGLKRTILSGLRNKIKQEELLGRKCLFILNLKPVKMRGIASEGMILVAKAEDGALDILNVPSGADVGAKIIFSQYPANNEKLIDGKSKSMLKVKESLKTDSNGFFVFKDDFALVDGMDGGESARCSSKICNTFVT